MFCTFCSGYLKDTGLVDIRFKYTLSNRPSKCLQSEAGRGKFFNQSITKIENSFKSIVNLLRQLFEQKVEEIQSVGERLFSQKFEDLFRYYNVTESQVAYICDHSFAITYLANVIDYSKMNDKMKTYLTPNDLFTRIVSISIHIILIQIFKDCNVPFFTLRKLIPETFRMRL